MATSSKSFFRVCFPWFNRRCYKNPNDFKYLYLSSGGHQTFVKGPRRALKATARGASAVLRLATTMENSCEIHQSVCCCDHCCSRRDACHGAGYIRCWRNLPLSDLCQMGGRLQERDRQR